ncbi:flavin-dependent oxidoreductase, F420-dependent methylene-tetrahydromethanopterin reductase [Halovivax ruber XH-70]|uniref:Flavin-dependent oxidoreductase, F420-dependent methylene-tetrahydromethanopterin reductase n=1 Tax=Halovivax ruber (strain DSM 18193 / JCM 13892 / XH-70) TaxID=797302 RepID=L0IFV2_HALRX|nr:LLM class flavin-dependent oxidoreductase [Halovivax ruber]AGB17111.1 flavin-dependent oxidoreductase, F420-dependent methylene-tetrahydromethanopterin reductase [Halovivax ruber XH-70]
MHVGIGLPNTLDADGETLLSWARRADDGPFSSIGVFDRLVYESTDPLTTLATCAGVTEDVRLATSIVAGPLRNDALLAKRAATVDQLSNGRLTLGLALGARREDYEAAGASYDDRGKRFSRQLSRLREIWDDDAFGPEPVQDSGPQVLVGGDSDPTFQRVGRYGDGYIHGGGPPRAFERNAQQARAAWTESGRPGDADLWGHGYVALGEEAEERGREYLLDYYAFTGPFAETIADSLLTTPQEVLSFVRGYADAGCDELLLFPTVADGDQYEKLETLIETEWR